MGRCAGQDSSWVKILESVTPPTEDGDMYSLRVENFEINDTIHSLIIEAKKSDSFSMACCVNGSRSMLSSSI